MARPAIKAPLSGFPLSVRRSDPKRNRIAILSNMPWIAPTKITCGFQSNRQLARSAVRFLFLCFKKQYKRIAVMAFAATIGAFVTMMK